MDRISQSSIDSMRQTGVQVIPRHPSATFVSCKCYANTFSQSILYPGRGEGTWTRKRILRIGWKREKMRGEKRRDPARRKRDSTVGAGPCNLRDQVSSFKCV